MHSPAYAPDPLIPNVALYLALRGRHGHKRCPRDVGEARRFALRNPEMGLTSEQMIRGLYGVPSPFLTKLHERYELLSTEMKRTVLWQEAAEIFLLGDGKRVLRLF